jgi:hypothetical protein
MTRDDMIKLAREADFEVLGTEFAFENFFYSTKELFHFAELVAAAEREACAKLCDAECNPTPNEGNITTYQSGGYITAEYLASAIRARGLSEN